MLKAGRLNLSYIESLKNPYDHNQVFNGLGILNDDFKREVFREMLPLYLSGNYMDFDMPLPGAVSYVRALLGAGAYVVFISSRYEDTQGEGTGRSLRRLGFVLEGESFQIMLRDRGERSIDFKKRAYQQVAGMKELDNKPVRVVLLFENEPENMDAMLEYFPDAMALFIRGAFVKPGPVDESVVMLDNYL